MTKTRRSLNRAGFARRGRRHQFESLEPRLALAVDLVSAGAFPALSGSTNALYSSPYDLGRGGGLVTDAAGNRYVTINSAADHIVDLDPGPGVNSVTMDSALVKLSPLGTAIWTIPLDTIGTAPVRILHAVDDQQNVYLVGDFRGTVDLDPGPGVTNITSRLGGTDYSFYMAKYNSAGQLQWTRTLDAPELTPLRVAVDGAGNLVMANNFTALPSDPPMDVDAGSGIVPIQANNVYDLVVLKYDTNGNFVWVRQIGNATASQTGEVPSLAVNPQGDVAVSGIFTGTLDLNPGSGTYNVTNPDSANDAFLVRLDANGNFAGAYTAEGSGASMFRELEFAADGSIIAAGYFKNTVDFEPGPGVQSLTAVGTYANALAVNLNSDLSVAWARGVGGNGEAIAVEADIDPQGNIYFGGSFGRLGQAGVPVDFDPGTGTFELVMPSTYETGFVLSLTSAGDFRWAAPLGGDTGAARVQGLSVSPDGDLQLSGAFKGDADFDPSPGAASWLNSGITQSVFTATFTQTVPAGGAPLVDAGASQTILINQSASLDGTVTDDGLPNPITTTWSKVSGPGSVVFADASAVDTTASFSNIGTYVLKLTAADGQFTTADYVTVVVNPLTATLTAIADTYLDGKSTTTNFGTSATLAVSGNPDDAALLKWDLSSIPAGSTLQSAKLSLNVTGTSANTYEIYELKRSWTESQATWKKATSSVNWQTAGADGALDRGTTVLGTVTASATGTLNVVLNAAGLAVVQGWVSSPATNVGFVLQDFDNANKDDLVFSSREATLVANRPQLQVVGSPGTELEFAL